MATVRHPLRYRTDIHLLATAVVLDERPQVYPLSSAALTRHCSPQPLLPGAAAVHEALHSRHRPLTRLYERSQQSEENLMIVRTNGSA